MTKWFTAVLALLAFTGTAHAVDITQCGQLVPEGETGILQNDLTCGATLKRCRDYPEVVCNNSDDCPNHLGCADAGLFLARSATLDLNGHTVAYDGTIDAIQCRYRGSCTVHDGAVLCSGVPSTGIWSASGRVTAHDLTITGCGNGIYAGKLKATRVTASGGGNGLVGQRTRAYDVTASDNAYYGIAGMTKLRLRNARTERNGLAGVDSRSFNIDGLESHDNGLAGLRCVIFRRRGGHGVISNSNITGNTYQGLPMDILSARPPRVENVVCDYSGLWTDFNDPAGPGLGVCAVQ